jgi:archaellum biogenesis ATPase FlaH
MKLKSLGCNFLTELDLLMLQQNNVQTAEQLLTYADLDSLSKLSTIPIAKLKLFKKFILGQYSPFPEPADRLFEKFSRKLFIIETGCPRIDSLISQGVYSNEITQFNGASSTGKSQFCFSLISNGLVKNTSFQCLYLDSSKSFCLERMSELVSNKLKIKYSKESKKNLDFLDEKVNKILKSIQIIDCRDVFHLVEILSSLSVCKSNDPDDDIDSTSLVVPNLLIIDNLSSLFNSFKCSYCLESFYYLTCISSYLKQLTMSMKMANIVVTNSDEQNSSKNYIFNTPLWTSVPNLIVNLKLEVIAGERERARKIELVKCSRPIRDANWSSNLVNEFCYFSINSFGIA